MFTWICPTCGREVPPSMSECPNCSRQPAPAPAAGQPAEPAAPAPPAVAAPAPAPKRSSAPMWLMSLLFAALFIAAGIAIYWGVGQWKERRTRAAAAPGISLETPGAAAGETPKPHPYQKFIEVTGVRLLQTEKKSIEARFLVVNHSPANIADMTATVTLRARGVDENEGAITFNVPSLGGYESREITAPVQTRLRVYELPDWQNLETQVRITAP